MPSKTNRPIKTVHNSGFTGKTSRGKRWAEEPAFRKPPEILYHPPPETQFVNTRQLRVAAPRTQTRRGLLYPSNEVLVVLMAGYVSSDNERRQFNAQFFRKLVPRQTRTGPILTTRMPSADAQDLSCNTYCPEVRNMVMRTSADSLGRLMEPAWICLGQGRI